MKRTKTLTNNIFLSPKVRFRTLFLGGLFLVAAKIDANGAGGCVYPYYHGDICGHSDTICVKWVSNPSASTCTGEPNFFMCAEYSVACEKTSYSKPGSSVYDCACDSNGWVQQGDVEHTQVRQAYNTFEFIGCLGG